MNRLYPPLKPCTTPWHLLLLNIALDHMVRGEKTKNEKSKTKKKKKYLNQRREKTKITQKETMTYIVQPPRVEYEVFSFCLIFLVRFEASMRDFIPKLGYELRLLKVCPREHQAVVLHAISPILMRLGQSWGQNSNRQTGFCFGLFRGRWVPPGFSWLSLRKSLQNR